MDTNDYQPERLTLKTFLQLYVRSFFFQGSFSVKYRQNSGFAFCIEPVGKILWDDPADHRKFLMRHTEYYNGNPFMITLVLGAVARMEEMFKYGEGITEDDISRFKRAVGPATGSIGDRFFWNTLRPFGIILGLFAATFYGLWGITAVLTVFNIPTIVLRWHWLTTGYRIGTGVVSEIQNRRLEGAVHIMNALSTTLLAFLTVSHVVLPDSTLSWVSVAAAGLFAVSIFLFGRVVRLSVVLLLSSGFALITGILLSIF